MEALDTLKAMAHRLYDLEGEARRIADEIDTLLIDIENTIQSIEEANGLEISSY